MEKEISGDRQEGWTQSLFLVLHLSICFYQVTFSFFCVKRGSKKMLGAKTHFVKCIKDKYK